MSDKSLNKSSGKNSNKKRKKKSKIKLHRILFIALLVYLSWTYIDQNSLKKDLEAKKMEEAEKISQLEEEVSQLKKEISSSNSLEFIEKIAREEMGMVKPREIIVIDKNK